MVSGATATTRQFNWSNSGIALEKSRTVSCEMGCSDPVRKAATIYLLGWLSIGERVEYRMLIDSLYRGIVQTTDPLSLNTKVNMYI